MTRSTRYEKSQRLNKAFELLSNGYAASRAAEELVGQFGISLCQTYRYLQGVQQTKHPVRISMPTIPMTIKIPKSIVLKLSTYAYTSNMTIGETVSYAVLAHLAGEGYHG